MEPEVAEGESRGSSTRGQKGSMRAQRGSSEQAKTSTYKGSAGAQQVGAGNGFVAIGISCPHLFSRARPTV